MAAKLDALELNPVEAQLLETVLARAEIATAAGDSDDAQGFGIVPLPATFKGSDEELQFTGMDLRLGKALGFHIHVNPYIGETEKN